MNFISFKTIVVQNPIQRVLGNENGIRRDMGIVEITLHNILLLSSFQADYGISDL